MGNRFKTFSDFGKLEPGHQQRFERFENFNEFIENQGINDYEILQRSYVRMNCDIMGVDYDPDPNYNLLDDTIKSLMEASGTAVNAVMCFIDHKFMTPAKALSYLMDQVFIIPGELKSSFLATAMSVKKGYFFISIGDDEHKIPFDIDTLNTDFDLIETSINNINLSILLQTEEIGISFAVIPE